MPKIMYDDVHVSPARQAVIDKANEIIAEYTEAGFDLTLRQLYYQFVARGLIPNSQVEYKKLGDTIGIGRMVGEIDWDAITDRTRDLRKRAEWPDPQALVKACAEQFRLDVWEGQKYRPEVWVEKDALVGVFQGVCFSSGVALFSCRGYTSLSELWVAARRLVQYILAGQTPIIFHFGDHDPSGTHMTTDLVKRLTRFVITDLITEHEWDGKELTEKVKSGKPPFVVQRLALNMDQIRRFDPPPNPAKIADPRAKEYIRTHGAQSWELDALDPRVLAQLVGDNLRRVRDETKYSARLRTESKHRDDLKRVHAHYPDVAEFARRQER